MTDLPPVEEGGRSINPAARPTPSTVFTPPSQGQFDISFHQAYVSPIPSQGQFGTIPSQGQSGAIPPQGPFDTNPSQNQTDPLPSAPVETRVETSFEHKTRLQKPPMYGGKRDRDAVRVWVNRMRMHLDSEATLSNKPYTDAQKIALAASFLEKEALDWYILYFVQHKGHPDIAPILSDFERWCKALQHRFQDVRTRQIRRDAWDALVQTNSAANFAQRIESDAMYLEPRPTEDDMLLLFKRGLRADIRARIEALPDDYVPQKYHAYTIFADKQERELQANRWQSSNRKGYEPHPKTKSSKPFFNHSQGHHSSHQNHQQWKKDIDGDTVMTLNTLRSARSKEEQEKWFAQCRERNACFKCGREGHKANACKTSSPGVGPTARKEEKGRSH